MSQVTLYSKKNYFSFNQLYWERALDLAKKFGWNPAGTIATSETKSLNKAINWEGSYLKYDSQQVDKDDAQNIAIALTKSLLKISKQWIPLGNRKAWEIVSVRR
jgi:hypothetical protein